MSRSGVPSTQSRLVTRSAPGSALITETDETAMGFGLAGERSVNARLVHPVDDLDPVAGLQALEGRLPGMVDLEAAGRAVAPRLLRAVGAGREGRSDPADEHEAGIGAIRECGLDLAGPGGIVDHDGIPCRS